MIIGGITGHTGGRYQPDGNVYLTAGYNKYISTIFDDLYAGKVNKSGGTMDGTLTAFNNSITPLFVKGTAEASIHYGSDDGNHNWVVGKGIGGSVNNFGFWNDTLSHIVALISSDALWHRGRINIGDHISLWCDNEGGNISILGNDGTRWSFDGLGGQFRFITNERDVPFAFHQDGTITTHKGNVVTTGNFSYSNGTLTITT